MDKAHFQHKILEAPYSRDVWKDVLRRVFSVKRLLQVPTDLQITNTEIAENAFELGSFETTDERVIGIYEVLVKPGIKLGENRVGLRSLLKQVYKDVDGALIVFVQGNKWRFSYVSEIKVLNEETETVEDKKTEPKRYTYLFGQGEVCRTAADRFYNLIAKPIKLDDLYDAFSVDKLNKEFFKRYKEFYQRGVQYLASNSEYYDLLIDKREKEEDKKQKPIRDFVKKLMGRIVFLHFLQKKGWMGCPVLKTEDENEKNWKGGKKRFIQLLYKGYENKQQFHSQCLRTLFFETLNTKRTNNVFSIPVLVNEESSEKALTRVPYLNGGLFDRDISYYNDLDFPVEFLTQLFDFFEQFNFTIDENDPYDSEVGIDPEMLGHIFENLLEENREKGAFYTPKEIVQYMCQQSLLQYLRTHLPECREDDSPALKALENFLAAAYIEDPSDKGNFIVKNAKRIDLLLHRVKICDPAIGSGAFPMGTLQLIFKIRMALALTQDRANLKKDIIQNNIYGVDIESGAVDIARLRFWLALVVDEEEPQPLPNLDYKIMQGNSLFERFDDIDLKFEVKRFKVKLVKEVDLFGNPVNPQISIAEYLQSKEGINEFDLTELEEKYFNSNNAAEKQEIKRKIDAFEKDFISQQIEKRKEELQTLIATKKKSVEKRKQAELVQHQQELEKLQTATKELQEMRRNNKPYFLWHLYFMDVFQEGGFDVVLGNPPYIRQENIEPKQKNKLREIYPQVSNGTVDIYVYFIQLGLNILKDAGVLSFITQNKWLKTRYGKELRNEIASKYTIDFIIDFFELPVFNEVATDAAVTQLRKYAEGIKTTKYYPVRRLQDYYSGSFLNNPQSIKSTEQEWQFINNDQNPILDKVESSSITLKEYSSDKIFRGLITGLNEAFELSASDAEKLLQTESAPLVKKFAKSTDITKYTLKNYDRYFLVTGFDIDIPTLYPSAFQHLKKYEEQLIKRDDQGKNWWNLRACKYYNEFEKPKLIYIYTAKNHEFYLDKEGRYINNNCYMIINDNKYLFAYLNSKLFEWYKKIKFVAYGDAAERGRVKLDYNKMITVPVKLISQKHQEQFDKLVEKAIEMKRNGLDVSKPECKIEALIFDLYALTETENASSA